MAEKKALKGGWVWKEERRRWELPGRGVEVFVKGLARGGFCVGTIGGLSGEYSSPAVARRSVGDIVARIEAAWCEPRPYLPVKKGSG